MLRKGVAEFAVILGLVIIAIVVAIYAYSAATRPPLEPTALGEEQKAVDTYVKDAMRRASAQTLDDLYNQGGYVDLSGARYLPYGGYKISYWQLCGNTKIPDVKKNYDHGIEEILKETLPANTHIAGKSVVFEKQRISADAQLFENKIVLNVRIPTIVGGEPMPQPYNIEIPAMLGRINNFASDFAKFQATYRALDYNLLRLIYRSNPDDCWLPTRGTEVVSSLKRSWAELRQCMQKLVYHTLAHTYEWEKPAASGDTLPKNMLHKSWLFQIVKENGPCLRGSPPCWGQYKELDITLYYGGGGRPLSRNSQFYFGTTGLDEKGETFGLLFGSFGPILSYDVKYDVSFPVVVAVWDTLLQRTFKFTTFVHIKGNKIAPGCPFSLSGSGDGGETGQVGHDENFKKCIEDATQEMKLSVVDFENNPLSQVSVTFDSCGPWMVIGGTVDGFIPPDMENGKLELIYLYGSDISVYSECADSADLAPDMDKEIRFSVIKKYDVHFYVVKINETAGGYVFDGIEEPTEEVVSVILSRHGNPCMKTNDTHFSNYDSYGALRSEKKVSVYPDNIYNATIGAGVSNGIRSGGFIKTGEFNVPRHKDKFCVYAPVLKDGIIDSDDAADLFQSLGIEPIVFIDSGKGVCPT